VLGAVAASWPTNWDALVAGEGCGVCAIVRGEESNGDLVIYESPTAVGFLVRRDIQRGYVIVSCRSHVVEPFELPRDEAAAYWTDILRVGRALHAYFLPKKLNYETWGNGQPHLHTHIVPRYEIDPHPGGGFPFWKVRDQTSIPDDELAHDADALRALLPSPSDGRSRDTDGNDDFVARRSG
jgi:diadenosine tetraphosphate (Ap4A) HIT family hydrolase